jgi:ankyrin repeat protein
MVEFEKVLDEKNYELVKSEVFNATVSMILDDEFESDDAVVNAIYSAFPDESKMSAERSWLPQHFAIALGVRNYISEDKIRIMLSIDPLTMDRLTQNEEGIFGAYNLNCRCALHLVAQYSKSLNLLQDILQTNHIMTQMVFESEDTGLETTPLGLLSKRHHFPTFDNMVLCLIEVDSTVEVIYDGVISCLRSYNKCLHQDTLPGSRSANSLILLGTFLNANPTVVKYDNFNIFHAACIYLKGELCISVLSLFLLKDSSGIKTNKNGNLLIHWAVDRSCVDVLKFLHKAWPESITFLDDDENSVLHRAIIDEISDVANVIAKVKYLCDQCPGLIHLQDYIGNTALHYACSNSISSFELVKILCDGDRSGIGLNVVRRRCTPFGHLPLHTLIETQSQKISELSNEGNCFRLLLRLHPAAAGIEDDNSESPYDMAVSEGLSAYFLRLLLSADPTIDPERRHDLNFAARRQGMFLAFSALSSNIEPTIWIKLRLKGRDMLEHTISYL